jgi:hypothetical protein
VYSVWVTFAQSFNSKFDPEDQWVVQGIAVPAPEDFAEANASTERHGVKVRVRGIVRGAVKPPWPRPPFVRGPVAASPGNEFLDVDCVDCEPATDVHLTVISVVDQNGFSVANKRSGLSRSFGLALRLRPESRTLTATFAIHRTHTLEWIIKPQFPPKAGQFETPRDRVRLAAAIARIPFATSPTKSVRLSSRALKQDVS